MSYPLPIPDHATAGEKYGPAMGIADAAEARRYLEACVDHAVRQGAPDHAEAERVERVNLAYFAGYHGAETRARVERLFACAHPAFGPVSDRGQPGAAHAYAAGAARAG